MLSEIKAAKGIPSMEIWIRRAGFKKSCMIMTDKRNMDISFPYVELVAAYLEIFDEATGQISRPELEEITEELEGCLVLYDREYRRIRVHPVGAEIRAGALLKQLAICAPYLFLGYMPWMDEEDQEEFYRIRDMVSVMRTVG